MTPTPVWYAHWRVRGVKEVSLRMRKAMENMTTRQEKGDAAASPSKTNLQRKF